MAEITDCPLCGTPCRVVGNTTLHYEPVTDKNSTLGSVTTAPKCPNPDGPCGCLEAHEPTDAEWDGPTVTTNAGAYRDGTTAVCACPHVTAAWPWGLVCPVHGPAPAPAPAPCHCGCHERGFSTCPLCPCHPAPAPAPSEMRVDGPPCEHKKPCGVRVPHSHPVPTSSQKGAIHDREIPAGVGSGDAPTTLTRVCEYCGLSFTPENSKHIAPMTYPRVGPITRVEVPL